MHGQQHIKRNTYLCSTSDTNNSLCVAAQMMRIAHSFRLRRIRTAFWAGFASVFRWNGEVEELNTVGLLERPCFIPSVRIVCMYVYETKLVLYNAKCRVSQIDIASRELNGGVLAERLQYLEYLLQGCLVTVNRLM